MERMRSLRFAPLLLAVALLATACGGVSKDGGNGSPEGNLLPADPLELPSMDFATFQALLDQLEGTPVVVNIWASWCGPCYAEAPDLARAAREYGDRVQFLGVDILDSRESAREFIRRFDWPYPSVFDSTGSIRDRLGFFGQPITIFYDADGDQVMVWNGAISPEKLEEGIRAILQ